VFEISTKDFEVKRGKNDNYDVQQISSKIKPEAISHKEPIIGWGEEQNCLLRILKFGLG
jgi:hypothetical protein